MKNKNTDGLKKAKKFLSKCPKCLFGKGYYIEDVKEALKIAATPSHSNTDKK